jgi:hypothetical protein
MSNAKTAIPGTRSAFISKGGASKSSRTSTAGPDRIIATSKSGETTGTSISFAWTSRTIGGNSSYFRARTPLPATTHGGNTEFVRIRGGDGRTLAAISTDATAGAPSRSSAGTGASFTCWAHPRCAKRPSIFHGHFHAISNSGNTQVSRCASASQTAQAGRLMTASM